MVLPAGKFGNSANCFSLSFQTTMTSLRAFELVRKFFTQHSRLLMDRVGNIAV